MAAHDIWKTTKLIPLLVQRGVTLSTAQVYRLVTDKPERLSMKTLVAQCDILSCTSADLIDTDLEAATRKTRGRRHHRDRRPVRVLLDPWAAARRSMTPYFSSPRRAIVKTCG